MRDRRLWLALLWVGLAGLTSSVVLLVHPTALAPAENRQQAAEVLSDGWSAAPSPSGSQLPSAVLPAHGTFAVIKIAKLGLVWPLVEGVELPDLNKGVGHFPGSAAPGQVGNFATAGHVCCAHNEPYRHLDQLVPGDEIKVQTELATYRYGVVRQTACTGSVGPNGNLVVPQTQVSVVDPAPCLPGQPSNRKLMTLVTCYPYTAVATPNRLVVFAELLV